MISYVVVAGISLVFASLITENISLVHLHFFFYCFKIIWFYYIREFPHLFRIKTVVKGISWGSSGQDSTLSVPRAQVQSLVGELRAHKPCGKAKTEKKKKTAVNSFAVGDTKGQGEGAGAYGHPSWHEYPVMGSRPSCPICSPARTYNNLTDLNAWPRGDSGVWFLLGVRDF